MHFNARTEDAAQFVLLSIGATKYGDKELLKVVDGYPESEQPWKETLNDLKRRGLIIPPKCLLPDGRASFQTIKSQG